MSQMADIIYNMELIKENWNNEHIKDLTSYLMTFSKGEESAKWEQRIVNTQMKCLAVPTPTIRQITNQIAKGNFINYVELMPWDNFSIVTILGGLICKIDDYKTFEKFLIKYANKIDNWAHCDLLGFNVEKRGKEKCFNLCLKLIKSPKPFARRVGIKILFEFANDKDYVKKIFEILNTFEGETHYYVNMINAWLVCELFVKQHDKTLEFFKDNKLNKFTQNKAISKCRDSFRVSKDDKKLLLQYRK